MFELSQLRCFVAVADELHFRRAAERLHMTQPPLSRQIQLLEHILGSQLFLRTNRSVQLTPVGRVFLPEARRILRLSDNALRWTQRVWRGEAGTLRIGFTAVTGYSALAELLDQLRAALPDVDVVLREMVSGAQLEALESGVLDVALVRPPVDRSRFCARFHHKEAFVIALPREHALATEGSAVPLTALKNHILLQYSPDGARYFFNIVSDILESAAIFPEQGMQVSQIHTMLGLVSANFGVALVPETASCLRFENVVFRPIDYQGVTARAIELWTCWRAQNDNPVLQRFVKDVIRFSHGNT